MVEGKEPDAKHNLILIPKTHILKRTNTQNLSLDIYWKQQGVYIYLYIYIHTCIYTHIHTCVIHTHTYVHHEHKKTPGGVDTFDPSGREA